MSTAKTSPSAVDTHRMGPAETFALRDARGLQASHPRLSELAAAEADRLREEAEGRLRDATRP